MSDDHGNDRPKHELSYYAKRIYAMRDLLIEKGVITEKDIQCQIEYQEARTPANGAKLVARPGSIRHSRPALPPIQSCVCRDGYRCHGAQRICRFGKHAESAPYVVCTLCSCYPRPILGRPPDWYKSFNYRQRSVSDRARHARVRLELPNDVEVARARQHRRYSLYRLAATPRRHRGVERG